MEEQILRLAQSSSNPRAASDIRAALSNITRDMADVGILRRRGDFNGAKKLEADLIKRLGRGWEPAKGRYRKRGERVLLPKMAAAEVKGFIEAQGRRVMQTPARPPVGPRTPGQPLGEYVQQSANRLAASTASRAYGAMINNDLREILMLNWPAPTS